MTRRNSVNMSYPWLRKKYSDVLLLMLASNYEDEANGHLRLFTITSLLTGFGFSLKSQMVYSKSWENAIRSIVTDKDTVACPKDVIVPTQIFSKESLPIHLKKKLPVNLIEYSGFVNKEKAPAKNTLRMLSFWLGVIVILASFFLDWFIDRFQSERMDRYIISYDSYHCTNCNWLFLVRTVRQVNGKKSVWQKFDS